MREKIIEAIKRYWYEETFPGVTMEEFIRDVVPLYNIMVAMGFRNDNGVVAITGESGRTWIAAYIATLLKGCTLVVIPKGLDRTQLLDFLFKTNTNLLITDDHNSNILTRSDTYYNLTLKGVYNAEAFEWKWVKEEIYNQTLSTACQDRSNIMLTYEQVEEFFYNEYTNDVRTIVTPTSATEYILPKLVVSSAKSIDALIVKSIDLLPYDMGDRIYCEVDFATSHFLTVLIPFLKGCVFTINPRDAEVFIENTQTLQLLWRRYVDSVLESRFLNWLFVKTPIRHLFNKVAVKRMKSYFNKGRKLKTVMVYNWFGPERIIATLGKKLPMFTTYGSQETNQLVAYNDYSSKELRQSNCAGKFIRGYDRQISTDFNELQLASESMFLTYLNDPDWTHTVRDNLWYYTGDIAEVNSDDLLFIYGRKSRLFADKTGFIVNLDNVERIIKNLPYVDEAVLVAIVEGDSIQFTLGIYPDESFVEAKGLSLLQFKDLVNYEIKSMERTLLGDHKISLPIRVKSEPFMRTFDGKTKLYTYPAINFK